VVTDGLKPGEWVIVTGIQRARPDKPVTPQRVDMPRGGMRTESQPVIIAHTEDSASKAGHP